MKLIFFISYLLIDKKPLLYNYIHHRKFFDYKNKQSDLILINKIPKFNHNFYEIILDNSDHFYEIINNFPNHHNHIIHNHDLTSILHKL